VQVHHSVLEPSDHGQRGGQGGGGATGESYTTGGGGVSRIYLKGFTMVVNVATFVGFHSSVYTLTNTLLHTET
jgi:hypothetical protein